MPFHVEQEFEQRLKGFFANSIKKVDNTADFVNNYNIDSSIQSFLNFSFKTIEGSKSHEIASLKKGETLVDTTPKLSLLESWSCMR